MKNVAVVMSETVPPFELSIFCEIFGVDRSADGLPSFEFEIVSERPGVPVATFGGITITPTIGLERLSEADLVALSPPLIPALSVSPALRKALHDVVNRGGRLVAVCSSAFTLAAAGLLDGRQAVTHWMHTEELASRYPNIDVQRNVLYIDDDPIFTSAGTAAGIDLCLHLIRKDHGSAVASAIARRMVAAPHRAGDRAQQLRTVTLDSTHGDEIDSLLCWALNHLDEDLSIETMAKRTFMSPRSFIRRFGTVTGTSPHAWVIEQRIRLAQQILEDEPEAKTAGIASRAGFRSQSVLREHFRRRFGCSPSSYRAIFGFADQDVGEARNA